MQKYIKEIIEKYFICQSNLSYNMLILIVRKPERGLHICVDDFAFNALVIKSLYTSPLIWETFTCLYLVKIYNKFDIITTFNQILIQEEDKEKNYFI